MNEFELSLLLAIAACGQWIQWWANCQGTGNFPRDLWTYCLRSIYRHLPITVGAILARIQAWKEGWDPWCYDVPSVLGATLVLRMSSVRSISVPPFHYVYGIARLKNEKWKAPRGWTAARFLTRRVRWLMSPSDWRIFALEKSIACLHLSLDRSQFFSLSLLS